MRSTNGNVQTHNGNVQTYNGNVQAQKPPQPSTFIVYEDHGDESNKTYETRSRSKARKESPTKKFKNNSLNSVSQVFECIDHNGHESRGLSFFNFSESIIFNTYHQSLELQRIHTCRVLQLNSDVRF